MVSLDTFIRFVGCRVEFRIPKSGETVIESTVKIKLKKKMLSLGNKVESYFDEN